MSGGPRYSFKTRVGNWQEEQRLEEAKFDSFRAAKVCDFCFRSLLSTSLQDCRSSAMQHSVL
jgi:hypothetical protein